MTKCIYCLKDGINFPAEHVIPKTLGSFGQSTYTLHNVCADCNKYFDRTFEEPVFRRSVFALFKHELFSEDAPNLRSKVKCRYIENSDFMKIKLVSNDIWNGALLALNIDNKTLELVPQVGFKIRDGEEKYEFFTFKYLQANLSVLRKYIDAKILLKDKNKVLIFGAKEKTERKLFKFLCKHGMPLKGGQLEYEITPRQGKQLTEIDLLLNDIVKRAIAKLAFNFFAHFIEYGNELPKDNIYKDYYNPIRKYIRFGERSNKWNPVGVNTSPIILGDKKIGGTRITANIKAHLITISSSGSEIIAQVCLFYPLGVFVFPVQIGTPKPVGLSIHEAKAFDYENNKIVGMLSRKIFDRARIKIIGHI